MLLVFLFISQVIRNILGLSRYFYASIDTDDSPLKLFSWHLFEKFEFLLIGGKFIIIQSIFVTKGYPPNTRLLSDPNGLWLCKISMGIKF